MFKMPNNILDLPKSTQVQWAIIALMIFYVLVLITTAGVTYVFQSFGFALTYDLGDVALIAFVIFVFNAFMKYLQFKKEMQHLGSLRDVAQGAIDSLDELQKNIEDEVGDEGELSRIIDVEVRGKSYPVLVRFNPQKRNSSEDLEAAVDASVASAFLGLVVDTTEGYPKVITMAEGLKETILSSTKEGHSKINTTLELKDELLKSVVLESKKEEVSPDDILAEWLDIFYEEAVKPDKPTEPTKVQ